MASSQLFSINANKNDKKREKLKADRFKENIQKGRSPVEALLVKRLREKNPPEPNKSKDEDYQDVWATTNTY